MNAQVEEAFVRGFLKAAGSYDPHASPGLAALWSSLLMPTVYPAYKEMKNHNLTGMDKLKDIDKGKFFSSDRRAAYNKRSYQRLNSIESLKGMGRSGLYGGLGGAALGAGVGALTGHSTPEGINANEVGIDAALGALMGGGAGAIGSIPFSAYRAAKRYNKEVIDNPKITKKTASEVDDQALGIGLFGAGLGGFLGGVQPANSTEAQKKHRLARILLGAGISGGAGAGTVYGMDALLNHR